ncbi:MAG: anaerobic sulfatase maturase [Opitutaceae bacterium]|nr:anaerobic sulfatase maturase [Opitutaceae bacterium]
MPTLPAAGVPRAPWSQPFHVLAKPIGARCNLDCRYCFYLDKETTLYPGLGVPRMSDATLERFTRDYLAAQPGEEVVFSWQGGEPTLLGVEFFARAVALQRRYAAGRRVTNALQTNGTLLDASWGEFLAREKFLVGVSIDGPRTLHDGYRTDQAGQPTWEKVMRGIRRLKKHRVEFNTLTVVHRRNVRHARVVYEFLREEGSGFMQFIPLVERRPLPMEAAAGGRHGAPAGLRERLVPADGAAEEVTRESVGPAQFGAFLTEVFDLWIRRDVGRTFVQLFDVALNMWLGLGATLCTFGERCGNSLALEHNGDVFACDHFVFPAHRLGNLHATSLADIGHGAGAARFGAAKADLPRVCRECRVRFACHGDCPKHRFIAANEGEPGVSYLCPAYRRFFTHIDPAMRRMAALVRAGRPAADIMR